MFLSYSLQCGGKRKPKEELKSQLPLVKELQDQENEHVEMEEVQQIQGAMDMTGNQDFGYKEQEEDLKDREKVLLTEKETPKEGKHKLLKNEGNLKRREKLVKERQQKLKEKDMELKLKKDLWQKKEEERKKRQEELQKEKHEVKHCDKNEQERKGKDLLGIRNYEGRKRAKRQAHFQGENSQLFVGGPIPRDPPKDSVLRYASPPWLVSLQKGSCFCLFLTRQIRGIEFTTKQLEIRARHPKCNPVFHSKPSIALLRRTFVVESGPCDVGSHMNARQLHAMFFVFFFSLFVVIFTKKKQSNVRYWKLHEY